MRVAIVGLGHLGSVTAGCLTKMGHAVIGIDLKRDKVAALNRGRPPVDEPGLARLIRAAWRSGRITAINRITSVVLDCDLILICVDTPRTARRSLSTNGIIQICEKLSDLAHESKAVPLVVIRSTLPPGAFDAALAQFCSPRGKLRMAYNPAFSREGDAIADSMRPQRIVIGVRDRHHASKLRQLYQSLKGSIFVTTWSNAEILKCADNAFHALKVTFANEIGSICESFGADGKKVMSLLCADATLNISPAYLRPGLPFGGPCLDKDVGTLLSGARQQAISAPLLRAILESNRQHFERIVRTVKTRGYRVGFLDLSHKARISDHRYSHLFALAKRLHAEGVEVSVFDPRLKEPGGSRSDPHSLPPSRNGQEILRHSDIVFTPRTITSVPS
jgi:GDP-mannose 6-dehydrogenase